MRKSLGATRNANWLQAAKVAREKGPSPRLRILNIINAYARAQAFASVTD